GVVLEEIAAARPGGVADEDVDPPEPGQGPLDDPFEGGACEGVPLDEQRPPAECLDLGDRRLRLRSALAVLDRDIGAGPRQLDRTPFADAARGPRHEGEFSLEVHRFVRLPTGLARGGFMTGGLLPRGTRRRLTSPSASAPAARSRTRDCCRSPSRS